MTVTIVSAIAVGIFALEFLDQYIPQKLSVIFFLLFWIPMLVIHELGHALVARVLGWRVREIVIGFGREIVRFELGETRVRIKLAPVEGYVIPEPMSPENVRLKTALIYAAGPGIELLLLFALILFLGWDTVFADSRDISLIAAKSLAVVIILGAGINLIPFRTDGGVSDGLGILLSPLQSEEAIEFRLAAAEVRAVAELLDAGDSARASVEVRRLVDRYPQNFLFKLMRAEVLSAGGRHDEAQALLEHVGAEKTLGANERREVWHLKALIEMDRAEPSSLVVDLALQKALELDPKAPALLITKGAALVLRGRAEEGGNLLANVFRQCEDREENARALAFLTIAAHRCGDPVATQRFREAFEHSNHSAVLAKKVAHLAPG